MRVRVVDASALGALVFGEPKAQEIANLLTDVRIIAPALLWFDLASICLKKIKTHRAQTEKLLMAFRLASQMSIEIVEVDHEAVIELARNIQLTTYDGSYLWLALHLDADLVTLDERLVKAAGPRLVPS